MIDSACKELKMAGSLQYMRRGASTLEHTTILCRLLVMVFQMESVRHELQ